MATKIIEYDTLIRPSLPGDGWPGYESVLILFRRGPHTLGVRQLPLSGGQVDRFQFERAVDSAIRKRIDLLIRERFGATPAREDDITISVVICCLLVRPTPRSSASRTSEIRSRFLIRWAAQSALISEQGMPQTFSV